MSKTANTTFRRHHGSVLAARLDEPRRFLNAVAGPRQAGKTTIGQKVLARRGRKSIFVSADEPALKDAAWLSAQWERARVMAKDAGKLSFPAVIGHQRRYEIIELLEVSNAEISEGSLHA